jgi:hypothetical protein
MMWASQERLGEIKQFLEIKNYRFLLIDDSKSDEINKLYPDWGWRFVPSTMNVFGPVAWRYQALTLWSKVLYDCLSHWLRTSPINLMFDEQYRNMTAGEFREQVIGSELEQEIRKVLDWLDELQPELQ